MRRLELLLERSVRLAADLDGAATGSALRGRHLATHERLTDTEPLVE